MKIDSNDSDQLASLMESPNPEDRIVVASSSKTSSSMLQTLIKDESDEVRKAVVSNANCPSEVLEIALLDKDYYVKKETVINPNVSDQIIFNHFVNKSDDLILSVLRNIILCFYPKLNEDLIRRALSSSHFNYKNFVAIIENRSDLISKETFLECFKENDETVQKTLINSKYAPSKLFFLALKSKSEFIRAEVAKQNIADERLALMLLADDSTFVRNMALKNASIKMLVPEVLGTYIEPHAISNEIREELKKYIAGAGKINFGKITAELLPTAVKKSQNKSVKIKTKLYRGDCFVIKNDQVIQKGGKIKLLLDNSIVPFSKNYCDAESFYVARQNSNHFKLKEDEILCSMIVSFIPESEDDVFVDFEQTDLYDSEKYLMEREVFIRGSSNLDLEIEEFMVHK